MERAEDEVFTRACWEEERAGLLEVMRGIELRSRLCSEGTKMVAQRDVENKIQDNDLVGRTY